MEIKINELVQTITSNLPEQYLQPRHPHNGLLLQCLLCDARCLQHSNPAAVLPVVGEIIKVLYSADHLIRCDDCKELHAERETFDFDDQGRYGAWCEACTEKHVRLDEDGREYIDTATAN